MYLILTKEEIYISQNGVIQDPVRKRIMELTFYILIAHVELRPVDGFSCHFHTLFGILGQRIIKLTENETGPGRPENNRGFTVIKERNKTNM